MNGDIAQLLYSIKVNIASIEGGDRSPRLFDEVRRDCMQMLELMKLFLISQRDSYYGYFLMNLAYEVDFTSKSIAGILLGHFPPVFCTNPLMLCKFSLKEILFIVCHEIDHIVLNHPAEMLKANPEHDPDVFEKFNLAADASVNDRILLEMEEEEHSFLAAPKGLISSISLKKMFKLRSIRSLESYLYYFNLIQGKTLPEKAQQGYDNIHHVNISHFEMKKTPEGAFFKATYSTVYDDHVGFAMEELSKLDTTHCLSLRVVMQHSDPTDCPWLAQKKREDQRVKFGRELWEQAHLVNITEENWEGDLTCAMQLPGHTTIPTELVEAWQKIDKAYTTDGASLIEDQIEEYEGAMSGGAFVWFEVKGSELPNLLAQLQALSELASSSEVVGPLKVISTQTLPFFHLILMKLGRFQRSIWLCKQEHILTIIKLHFLYTKMNPSPKVAKPCYTQALYSRVLSSY